MPTSYQSVIDVNLKTRGPRDTVIYIRFTFSFVLAIII